MALSCFDVDIAVDQLGVLLMAGLSIWHVVIFAIVVILLFGTSKLKNLGKDVGGAVKDFKKSIKEEETATASLNEPRTLEHQTTNSDSTIKQ
jgi:sec-independent protein translocase protein TatA